MQDLDGNIKFARFSKWLPTPGNVIFTLLVISVLVWAQATGAFPAPAPERQTAATSTGTVAYQGRLADSGGTPLTGTYPMVFRLYNTSAAGAYPLWEENWAGSNSVQVSDGLFNVMLGTLTPISQTLITQNSTLWLGISVGSDDEMSPRVQLGSVPFAVQANTVLNGSITTEKLIDGAVTAAKIVNGAVGSSEVADNSLTASDLAVASVGSSEVVDESLTASDLAANSVGSSEIAAGAVTQSEAPALLKGPGNNWRIESAGQYFSPPGVNGGVWQEHAVTFSSAFSSPPKVLISLFGPNNGEVGCWKHAGVSALSTTGFSIKAFNDNCGWLGAEYYWVAIGQ